MVNNMLFGGDNKPYGFNVRRWGIRGVGSTGAEEVLSFRSGFLTLRFGFDVLEKCA